MDVAVIGMGFIGQTLGARLTAAGHHVLYGTRHADDAPVLDGQGGAEVLSVGAAIAGADVVLLTVPGTAVSDVMAEHGDALEMKLVIDATNKLGEPVANARNELARVNRYARAFNSLGGEVMNDPGFPGGQADMFFSVNAADRSTLELLIGQLGMNPVYLGDGREDVVDDVFRLWIRLALDCEMGRRIAFKLLD